MQHHRREVVQQVRVVDREHQPAAPHECVQGAGDRAGGVPGGDVDEPGERAERERVGRPAAERPRHSPRLRAAASRARRVFPTPAAPDTRIPAAPGRMAAVTALSSPSRPVSGHCRPMP